MSKSEAPFLGSVSLCQRRRNRVFALRAAFDPPPIGSDPGHLRHLTLAPLDRRLCQRFRNAGSERDPSGDASRG